MAKGRAKKARKKRKGGRPRDATTFARRSSWNGKRPSSYLCAAQWRSIVYSLALSPGQEEIVRCIMDGLTEPAIAEELGVSCYTVHSQVARVYKKIEVTSRTELIVRVFLVVVTESRERSS